MGILILGEENKIKLHKNGKERNIYIPLVKKGMVDERMRLTLTFFGFSDGIKVKFYSTSE